MSVPVVDMNYKEYMDRYLIENVNGNCPNLCPVLSRGRNRLIPIPYNKRCKIVLSEGFGWWFYQFTYTTYPNDFILPKYNDAIDKALCLGLIDAEEILQNRSEYPYSDVEDITKTVFAEKIKPREEKTVYRDTTSGALTAIYWDITDIEKNKREDIMKNITLRIKWDGEAEDAVCSPLGAFFASHPGYNVFRTLPMGMIADRCYCYFYMPYEKAQISLKSELDYDVLINLKFVKESITQTEAHNLMRFHAIFREGADWGELDRNRFIKGGDRWPDWPIIRIKGKGRLCGIALHINNSWEEEFPEVKWWEGELTSDYKLNCHWWGEEDEKFFVDGEKFPSTFGTGSEDYIGFSYAANYPFVTFDSGFSAQSRVPRLDNNGLTSLVRFHIADNIPFNNSFEGYIEKYVDDEWDNSNGICLFCSTVYWYKMI